MGSALAVACMDGPLPAGKIAGALIAAGAITILAANWHVVEPQWGQITKSFQKAFDAAAASIVQALNDIKIKASKRSAEDKAKKKKSKSDHMLGENGTKVGKSITTGSNGPTERVDVENPAPGEREGNVHYHEPNNTKWRYDVESGQLVNPKSGNPAPPRVQRVLKQDWFQKAIGKALNILGE